MRTKNKTVFAIFIFLIGCSNQEHRQVGDNHPSVQGVDKSLEYLYNEANENYKGQRFAEAILLLDSLIRIDSMNGDYFFKRGYSKAQIGIRESSTNDFLRAVHLEFKISKSYHNIGMNEVVLGHDSLAVLYFEKALEADPFNARAKRCLICLNEMKCINDYVYIRYFAAFINWCTV